MTVQVPTNTTTNCLQLVFSEGKIHGDAGLASCRFNTYIISRFLPNGVDDHRKEPSRDE